MTAAEAIEILTTKTIVLLFGVLSRICRILPKAEALLRSPHQWELIRKHWNIACASGGVPEDDQKQLPTKPIRVGQWRYAQDLLTADPDSFARFEPTFIESSVELAIALGYFDQGSITNPAKSSCLFADGTEARSQCRSYVEPREDPETGTKRPAAIDPVAKHRVREWLERDSTGHWRARPPACITRSPACRSGRRSLSYFGHPDPSRR